MQPWNSSVQQPLHLVSLFDSLILVFRLKKAWKLVPKKDLNLQEELLQYVSSKGNFKLLRDAIIDIQPPCIPYIGLLLRDLTYADDAHPDQLNDKINFKKRKQIASLIRSWKSNLNAPYELTRVDDLISILNDLPEVEEGVFNQLSNEAQPK
jgi:Rap guanine nucleotide exchange factor 1